MKIKKSSMHSTPLLTKTIKTGKLRRCTLLSISLFPGSTEIKISTQHLRTLLESGYLCKFFRFLMKFALKEGWTVRLRAANRHIALLVKATAFYTSAILSGIFIFAYLSFLESSWASQPAFGQWRYYWCTNFAENLMKMKMLMLEGSRCLNYWWNAVVKSLQSRKVWGKMMEEKKKKMI